LGCHPVAVVILHVHYPSIYPVLQQLSPSSGNQTPFLSVSPSDFRGLVFGFFSISCFFSDERGAGPLRQPPTWRIRWFLVKVFFLSPSITQYQTSGQQC